MQTYQPKLLSLGLYLVASRGQRSDDEFLEIIAQALQGGVDILQLREKTLSSKEFYTLACKLKEVCAQFDVPFLINDRLDIALACGADGVHIGSKDDLPLHIVREILGEDKIIGLSVNTLAESKHTNGADYLGVGAVFATPSKSDSVLIGIDGLQAICENVALPVVAIGGINEQNLDNLAHIGIAGVAVIRAIMDSACPKEATKDLKAKFLSQHNLNNI